MVIAMCQDDLRKVIYTYTKMSLVGENEKRNRKDRKKGKKRGRKGKEKIKENGRKGGLASTGL